MGKVAESWGTGTRLRVAVFIVVSILGNFGEDLRGGGTPIATGLEFVVLVATVAPHENQVIVSAMLNRPLVGKEVHPSIIQPSHTRRNPFPQNGITKPANFPNIQQPPNHPYNNSPAKPSHQTRIYLASTPPIHTPILLRPSPHQRPQ